MRLVRHSGITSAFKSINTAYNLSAYTYTSGWYQFIFTILVTILPASHFVFSCCDSTLYQRYIQYQSSGFYLRVMQSNMTFILWLFAVILYVQARSIAGLKSDERIETFRKHDDKGFHSEKYYKLLRHLLNHRMNIYNEDNDDLSSRTKGDASVLLKRSNFLFPSRASIKRYRPTHAYGRKSHWDTFFG
ncbi:unnamed protein product [Rotaria socialis]